MTIDEMKQMIEELNDEAAVHYEASPGCQNAIERLEEAIKAMEELGPVYEKLAPSNQKMIKLLEGLRDEFSEDCSVHDEDSTGIPFCNVNEFICELLKITGSSAKFADDICKVMDDRYKEWNEG